MKQLFFRLTAGSKVLLAMFLLPVAALAADEVKTHTSSLPKDVTLPTGKNDYAFLEGEKAAKAGDILKDKVQKERTFFCEKNTPNDKWWGSPALYDKSRASTRGANTNQPWHSFSWNAKQAGLTAGIYDVFARVMITPGGSAELGITTGKGVPKQTVATKKVNIFWQQVGSLEVNAATQTITLYMRTTKSTVCLDTVLLVRETPQTASTSFERIDRIQNAWSHGNGMIFDNGRGEIVYRAERPEMIAQVQAAIQTVPGQSLSWKNIEKDRKGEWSILLDSPGWYDVKVQARTRSGKKLNRDVTVAVLGTPISEKLRQQSVFGIWNVHGDSLLVKLAGAKWNRRMLSFRDVTKEQVATTTSEYAHFYTGKDGLEYLGVFAFGMPMWCMKVPESYKRHGFGNPFFPPKNWNAVADIVKTYAHLKEIPETVEMYNEPLAHWKGDKKGLVAYAEAVRKGLKAANPKFKLAGPCLYSIRIEDLNALARAGLFKHLDAISMHAYVNGTPPEGKFLDKIIEMNQLLAQYGQQNKPVYLTEFGWTASDGTWQQPVDRKTQTSYVARSLALGWSQKIDALIFFVLRFNTSNRGEAAFSLLDKEDRPQPGYVAFSAVARFFAGSKPFGCYQLTPDVHMVAGKRDSKLQIALWSTGKAIDIALPFNITGASDIFGKKFTCDPQKIHCTENPVYLEAEADGVTEIKQLAPIKVTAGGTLPANIVWPLKAIETNMANLSAGNYAGLSKNGKVWNIHPVNLVNPLTLRYLAVWPLDRNEPEIKVTVCSNLADKTQNPQIWIDNGRRLKLKIPANGIREAIFPIRSFVPAKKTTTKINLQTENEKVLTSELEWSMLAAVAPGKKIPWADFSEWHKFGKGGNGDLCSGKVKLFYDAKGILLEVKVTDDEHHQPQAGASPGKLWAADSIQVAFDLDASKPWDAGVVGAGLSGHRVFEYSIGASASGQADVFRERSYIDGLPANVTEPRVNASLKREGNETTYSILFPWSTLGADKPLPIGSVIGFSLAVNDVDPSRKAKRHGISLFKGIVESKDPHEYGKVYLR